jgi:hypothetical protein
MEGSTAVPTSVQKANKTAGKASLRTAIKQHQPPKVRKNGMVKSTILFDVPTNERLSALAFAWNTDRSELARELIAMGLERYDIAAEVRKAAAKFASDAQPSGPGASTVSAPGASEVKPTEDAAA